MTLKTGLQLNSLAPGGPLNVMQTLKLSIVAKSLKLNQHHPFVGHLKRLLQRSKAHSIFSHAIKILLA
jgi:hypothetical protein